MTNTPTIKKRRFAYIPADILQDNSLSRPARWLFTVLCSYADPDGLCWPSLRKIADQEGVSRRSVQTWLKELVLNGRVVIQGTRGRANLYWVIRDKEPIKPAKQTSPPGKVSFTGTGVKRASPKQHQH